MRILLDQDQVLANWVGRVLEWYNEDHGTKHSVDDVHDWGLSILGESGKYFVRSVIRYPDFYQDLEPIPGAIEGVKALIDKGHDVVIVSAVPPSAGHCYHGKLVWLRKHMPFFDLNNFVAAQKKQLVSGDILVDDNTKNLEAFAPYGTAIAFDYHWNDDFQGLFVSNWTELLTLIDRIENETGELWDASTEQRP